MDKIATEPLVSICIPTYKQTFFLKKCLDSVFIQTYTNYEVILTDDTPDDTVKDFVNKNYSNKKINYFKNERSLGSPANWNYAVSKAKGQFVKILHHDDHFTFNDSLEKFVKALDKNKDADFVFSLSSIHNADTGKKWENNVTDEMLEKVKLDPTYLISGNFIGSPSATMYRKSAIVFDEKLKWLVDLDFYISILLKNKKVVFINEALITTTNAAAHQITNSCINNPKVELFEYSYLLDKYKRSVTFNDDLNKVFLNLFYNYKITSIDGLEKYYANAKEQERFYTAVFKEQSTYNFKRKLTSKIKGILGKNI